MWAVYSVQNMHRKKFIVYRNAYFKGDRVFDAFSIFHGKLNLSNVIIYCLEFKRKINVKFLICKE